MNPDFLKLLDHAKSFKTLLTDCMNEAIGAGFKSAKDFAEFWESRNYEFSKEDPRWKLPSEKEISRRFPKEFKAWLLLQL